MADRVSIFDRFKEGDIYEGRRAAWVPQPRQEEFMRRFEDEVLFGGAAGGGKSDAIVAEALRQIHIPHYKGLILRKTYPQLAEIIEKTYRLYPQIDPKARYNSTSHTWRFSSGAKIIFGSLPHPKDKYKEICDKHSIPVYELAGNHECFYEQDLTKNLDKWETYTGQGTTSYAVAQGNDLFILLGQSSVSAVVSDADFQWFSATLAANKDKRCFVFVHSYIEEDSGDAGDYRENSIFQYWGTAKRTAFMDLLKQYPNVILFHGHSHIKFEWQKIDDNATYTEKNGFKSVHIPSLCRPRNIDESSATTPYADSESQGYIVDVYDDCIVLNGMDLISNIPVPIGVYRIDTAP